MSGCSASALQNNFKTLPSPRLTLGLLLCLLFSVHPAIANAQDKPPACSDCHAGVTSSYAHAAMHHALETPGANPTLESHPNLAIQQGKYRYTVQTRNGRSTYTVSDGADSITVPIRWIFGQHAQTWMLEKDGNLYESLVSYFPLDQGLATTPGDAKIVPTTLLEAFGRKVSSGESLQCFGCHATNVVKGKKLDLENLSPGVGCERCHAGSAQHMVDAVRGNFSSLPKALKKMNAEDTVYFCGECHRSWDATVRNHWHGASDVRFQPYRLASSKCFIGNDPRISCLACHNPHQQADHNLIAYDIKCLACHAKSAAAASTTPIKTCPVSKSNCVSCHMPRVPLPGGHAIFTDHLIRIVKPGEPYPY